MIQLSAGDPATISSYLTDRSLLAPNEVIASAAPAGEGNMNVTLKVTTNQRTFITKQSRPYVAKYPDIPAPVNRITVESRYLERTAAEADLADHHPAVLHFDADNFVLLLEYLDGATDMSDAYTQRDRFTSEQRAALADYLSALHRLPVGVFPANRELRALNHAHIFDLPFRPDNGFPLDDIFPGLAGLARPFQEDEALRGTMAELGGVYLADGPTLVHGDFYPGSFMKRGGEVFVIDGEFAHPGRPEFDLGVLLAHLDLAGIDGDIVNQRYEPPAGFDAQLAQRFRGAEIMRRLIGIAQLPLALDLNGRRQLLERGRELVE